MKNIHVWKFQLALFTAAYGCVFPVWSTAAIGFCAIEAESLRTTHCWRAQSVGLLFLGKWQGNPTGGPATVQWFQSASPLWGACVRTDRLFYPELQPKLFPGNITWTRGVISNSLLCACMRAGFELEPAGGGQGRLPLSSPCCTQRASFSCSGNAESRPETEVPVLEKISIPLSISHLIPINHILYKRTQTQNWYAVKWIWIVFLIVITWDI